MSDNLINYEEALERLGGDTEFLEEMLREMVTQIDASIEPLQTAVQKADHQTIHQTGHGLKGACSNMSLIQLTRLFKTLEELGQDQKIGNAQEIIIDIKTINDELREYINGL